MTGPEHALRAPQELIRRMEADARLDRLAGRMRDWGHRMVPERAQQVLGGDWMGHPLHPLLTDVTIGFWTSATVLDLVGGRGGRTAAQRLVALGAWSAVPTFGAGFVELMRLEDVALRRVAVVHAIGNAAAEYAFVASWVNRHRDQHFRGVVWALVGGGVASVTGHLGGHLAFGRTSTVEPGASEVMAPVDPPATDHGQDVSSTGQMVSSRSSQPVG